MILATDTDEERKEKYQKINENYEALKNARHNTLRDILDIVDLFKGNISLNDILNLEMPLINGLRDEKVKRVQNDNAKSGKQQR